MYVAIRITIKFVNIYLKLNGKSANANETIFFSTNYKIHSFFIIAELVVNLYRCLDIALVIFPIFWKIFELILINAIWFQSKLYDDMLCSPHIKLESCPNLGDRHGRMMAKSNIAAKSEIIGIEGRLFPLGKEKENFDEHFSLMKCSGSEHLLLGPLSFVNHSCEPNAVYKRFSSKYSDMIVSTQALRDIEKGEEITVSYGKSYFNNDICLCSKCLRRAQREPPQRPENHVHSLQNEVIRVCCIFVPCTIITKFLITFV